MLRTFFISILLVFLFNISSCNPLAGAPHLYSSSYIEEDLYSYTPSYEVQALKDSYLKKLFERVSCDDFKSHIWHHIYITLFNQKHPPSPLAVQREVKSFAQSYLLHKGANNETIRLFAQNFSKIYKQALEFFANKTAFIIMGEIALIELMDDLDDPSLRSHPELIQFVTELDKTFNDIERIISPLNLSCAKKEVRVSPLQNIMKSSQSIHPLVAGARKVMATAYQSCKVLDFPLVSSKTSEAKGIREISTSKSGGVYRSISSLPQLLSSHYYLSQLNHTPSSRGCPNISRNPLLYDFGGKPVISMYPYPQINLFKNAGSGSHILGLDCSGFVMSALATAGLRIKRNKSMKSSYISGISSWNFKDTNNNFNCLEQLTIKEPDIPLRTGDIITVSGHIMIVDQLGKNPLGIDNVTSPYQCESIGINQMNFSIIQSSSDLNAIGINRMHVRHVTNDQLIKGLTDWAVHNCKKKWGYSSFNSNDISISRHKLTPECRESEMYLLGEECISSCSL